MTSTPTDFTIFKSRLNLVGALELKTALRVGVGRSEAAAGIDLPVVKDVLGQPFIPGSSFKGALRSHLEAILRTIQTRLGRNNLACLSVSKPNTLDYAGCLTPRMVQKMKEDNSYRPAFCADVDLGNLDLDARLITCSCRVCRVFGAPWLASKALVKDMAVDNQTWYGHFQSRDGVAIDRDTGTAAEGFKYDFEAVPAGTRFSFEMVLENASPAEAGMVLLALNNFEAGRVPLGGGRSRGLGWVQLLLSWAKCSYVDETNLLDYLLKDRVLPFDQSNRDEFIKSFIDEEGLTGGEEAASHAQTDGE